MVRVINERNGREFLSDLEEARGPLRAFAGLMFRASLPGGRGLLLQPARGIHTHFMRFPIDLVYLDDHRCIQAIRAAVPPWSVDLRRAAAVIETSAGAAAGADLRVGDHLRFVALGD